MYSRSLLFYASRFFSDQIFVRPYIGSSRRYHIDSQQLDVLCGEASHLQRESINLIPFHPTTDCTFIVLLRFSDIFVDIDHTAII